MAFPDPTNTPLVGRAPERALLRELLETTLLGQGAFLLIGGEAGIGKTTLVDDLLATARRHDVLTLSGHSYDLTATPPYGPWQEIVASLWAETGTRRLELAHEADPAADERLPETLRDLLLETARKHCLVVVLEDLHWADAASLDALRAIARDVSEHRVLLIATYRREDVARGDALYQMMPWLVRESKARRIDLRRLNQNATRELVTLRYQLGPHDLARLVAYLQRYGEGNPLFIEELLQTLEYEQILERADGEAWALGELHQVQLPALIRQIIDSRVDRLGAVARRALEVAAIIGQQAPFDLWRTVSGLSEPELLDVLAPAIDANVLTQARDGAEVLFTHALIREALYDGMLAPLRRNLHRGVAEALLSESPPPVDGLAYHFQRAGDPRMLEWLIRAGDRAERAYAWRDAVAQFQAALTQAEQAGQLRHVGWLRYRIGTLERHANVERSLAHFDDAYRLANQVDDTVLHAFASYARGLLRVHTGAAARGLPEMYAGIEALIAMPRADRMRLNATPGVFNPSAPPDLLSAPQPSAAVDEEGDDGPWPGDYDRFGTYAYYSAGSGRLLEALALTEQLTQQQDPLAPLLGHIHEGRGYVLSWLGRPADSETEYQQARAKLGLESQHVQLFLVLVSELEAFFWPYQPRLLSGARSPLEHAEHVGRLAGAAFPDDSPYQIYLMPTYFRLGRWDEMEEVAARANIPGSQYFIRQKVSASLGWLDYWRADDSAAWRQVHAVLPRGAYTEPGDDSLPGALDALRLATALQLTIGDLDEAQRAVEAQERWLAWSGAHVRRAEAALDRAHLERARGALEQAQAHAQAAHALAAQPEQPLALAATLQLLGELAAERGDAAEARGNLTAAQDLLRRLPCPFELARCRLTRAEIELELGDFDVAGAQATAALDTFRALRAERMLERAMTLLDTLAAKAQPNAGAFAALTARELDVLRCAAKGMTDVEIGQQLFISPRTVGAHMRSIFSKLNVNSRAAAARIAGEQRLV